MQVYRLRASLILVSGLLLWLLSAQFLGIQTRVQAAMPEGLPMLKATPTPYVPPAEQGGSVNLVCGAAVLVIIIVGGVIWAQRSLGVTGEAGNTENNENPSGQLTR